MLAVWQGSGDRNRPETGGTVHDEHRATGKAWLTRLAVVLPCLAGVPALAQAPTHELVWEHERGMPVSRFEVSIDGAAWSSIGLPARETVVELPTVYVYAWRPPATQQPVVGRTYRVRACNDGAPSSPCGDASDTLTVGQTPVVPGELRLRPADRQVGGQRRLQRQRAASTAASVGCGHSPDAI